MFNQTTGAAILKTTFTPRAVQALTAEASKFSLWALLDKKEMKLVKGAFGSTFTIPIQLDDTEAVGTTLAAARAKSTTTGIGGEVTYRAFAVSPIKFYGSAVVDGADATMADGDDGGSFLDATKKEMTSVMKTMSRHFAVYSHGSGYSEVGKIKAGSSVTSTTIVVRRGDRRKLRIGMDLVAGATLAGTLISNTPLRITGLASDGTVTLSASPSALSWVAGSYLFNANARSTSANTRTIFTGLAAYNPVVEPSSTTTIHGVDINANFRLSGMRVKMSDLATGSTVLDGLKALMVEMDAEGEPPTHAICNTEEWQKVVALLPDQTVYKTATGEGTVGFDTVKVRGPGGVVELICDPTAEPDEIRVINKAHLFWAYNGDALINIINEDGNTWRQIAGADQFEVQMRSILALCCDKPNSLGVLVGPF